MKLLERLVIILETQWNTSTDSWLKNCSAAMSNAAASRTSPSGDITRDAFKLLVANHVAINIGSFNYGISQTMLQGKPWRNKHVAKFKTITSMLFELGELSQDGLWCASCH